MAISIFSSSSASSSKSSSDGKSKSNYVKKVDNCMQVIVERRDESVSAID